MKNPKLKKRIVALLLCGAMLLGFAPSSVSVLLADADDTQSLSTASTSTEVVSLRDANTKHFHMGNGVYKAITYSHPVHELDSEGAWQDIDFGLALTGTRSNRMYTNEASGAAFAEKYVANQPIMTLSGDGDSISMSMNTIGSSGAASRAANTAIAAEVTNPQKTLRTFEEAENAVFSSKILYEEVLPGVDLEYVVDPGTVKENIIVKEKRDTYQYSFSLNLAGLYPVMLEDGSIVVYDLETDEQKYDIPAPFMYDAYGELSEDVAYTLTGSGSAYTLTVTANADWINAQGRDFPVTIDPTYVVSTEDVDDTYIDSDKPNTRLGSSAILWARHNRISYIKVPTPSIPSSATVQWAALSLYFYYYQGITGSVNLAAHRVTTPWEESTLTWNEVVNKTNYGMATTPLDTSLADAGTALEHTPEQVAFTITDTFKKWIDGTYDNYGIGVKYVSPSESMSVIFYSSEGSYTYRPRITYQYTFSFTSISAGSTHNLSNTSACNYAFTPIESDTYSLWTTGNTNSTIKVYDEVPYTSYEFQATTGGHGNNACLTVEFEAGKQYIISVSRTSSSTSPNCYFKLYRGLPLSGSELPNYFSEFNQYCLYNNCYTYAISSWVNPINGNIFRERGNNPGEISGNSITLNDLLSAITAKSAIIDGVKSDCVAWGGSAYDFYEVDANTMVPQGYYKVALTYRADPDDPDYHWYRQISNSDGRWTHKRGLYAPEDIDANGEYIYVPHLADWGNYTHFLGYFAIKPPARANLTSAFDSDSAVSKSSLTAERKTQKTNINFLQFVTINPGITTKAQVQAIAGDCHTYYGSGFIYEIYYTNDERIVAILYDEKNVVCRISEGIQNGADLDLIPMSTPRR